MARDAPTSRVPITRGKSRPRWPRRARHAANPQSWRPIRAGAGVRGYFPGHFVRVVAPTRGLTPGRLLLQQQQTAAGAATVARGAVSRAPDRERSARRSSARSAGILRPASIAVPRANTRAARRSRRRRSRRPRHRLGHRQDSDRRRNAHPDRSHRPPNTGEPPRSSGPARSAGRSHSRRPRCSPGLQRHSCQSCSAIRGGSLRPRCTRGPPGRS